MKHIHRLVNYYKNWLIKTQPNIFNLWRFGLYQRPSSEEVCLLSLLVLATIVMRHGKKLVVRVAQCVAALFPVHRTLSLLLKLLYHFRIHCFLIGAFSELVMNRLCKSLFELPFVNLLITWNGSELTLGLPQLQHGRTHQVLSHCSWWSRLFQRSCPSSSALWHSSDIFWWVLVINKQNVSCSLVKLWIIFCCRVLMYCDLCSDKLEFCLFRW